LYIFFFIATENIQRDLHDNTTHNKKIKKKNIIIIFLNCDFKNQTVK